jgi:ketosteroid isomerase-like protein
VTPERHHSDDKRLARPITPETVAEKVRSALDAGDLAAFGDLLSPDVHWGAPGDANPPCQNRAQVLKWYEKGRARGRRGTVTEVSVHGNAVLVGLRLNSGEDRWQVLRVGPDGIRDIRGYEDRASATERLSL